MPRAHRHYLPGLVWHITHRCHKQAFLLRFARDRRSWRRWLFEARKRYGLCVLNYIATSNHIHLLVRDRGEGEIARSMQLIAGQTAQAYNRRKARKGAFWEDRYHATAVETGEHLARCLTYIDLNMVRAGAVAHPSEWEVSGYNEIQTPPSRYRIVDTTALQEALGVGCELRLRASHAEWVTDALRSERSVRDARWSESLAVGSEAFAGDVQERLGVPARNRDVWVDGNVAHLKEPSASYRPDFGVINGGLRRK